MEEKRFGEYFLIYEDERGIFFFNLKDLCMIEYILELIKFGIISLKIEGRMKIVYYVVIVVRVYRMVIDEFYRDLENWKFNLMWMEELKKGSYRYFILGFYLNKLIIED